MATSSTRPWWRLLLLPALVLVLLSGWAMPAQMQTPADPPEGFALCGNPHLGPVASQLRRSVTWRPLEDEALREQGKLSAQGELQSDTVGQQRQFWASDFTSSGAAFYSVTATCRAVGSYVYVYVEDGQTVSDSVVASIVNQFDNTIYPQVNSAFGDEPNPGVDGDPRVYLLLLDIRDGYTGGGYVAGYFYALNEFPNEVLPAPYAGYSNEKEMIYVDTYPSTAGDTSSLGTIAHEFQHMVHWWMDWEGDEETWVDEGCADLAQYLCGYGHPRSHLYTGIPSYPGFLEEPDHQLTQTGSVWDNEPHILASYGAAYMWTLYLWEHYGGDATIRALVDEDANGIASVNNALAARGYSKSFDDVYLDWVVANYLDDGIGPYGYQSIELLATGTPDYETSFPRPAPAATHSTYPVAVYGAGVDDFAADAIKLTGSAGKNLALTFDSTGDSRFGVAIVRSTSANLQPGTNTVSSMSLNTGTWSGTAKIQGAEAVLLIPASLAQSGGHTYSYGASFDDITYSHFTYLPLALRGGTAPTPSGPRPGHWETNEGTDFYVTPDGRFVRNFRTIVPFNDGEVDCGTWYLTLQTDVPIANNQFSFTGALYGTGTFTSQTSANLAYGINQYPMCGYYWNGPTWTAVATWKDASQPEAGGAGILSAEPATETAAPQKPVTHQ